jgi:hypothetical protein
MRASCIMLRNFVGGFRSSSTIVTCVVFYNLSIVLPRLLRSLSVTQNELATFCAVCHLFLLINVRSLSRYVAYTRSSSCLKEWIFVKRQLNADMNF